MKLIDNYIFEVKWIAKNNKMTQEHIKELKKWINKENVYRLLDREAPLIVLEKFDVHPEYVNFKFSMDVDLERKQNFLTRFDRKQKELINKYF